MSRVEICSLAYEGKFNELTEKIELKPNLATKLDENERMPLHWAASGGHSDIVKHLLDLGVPTDNKDDAQWTPLMIAASAGRDTIVYMLISIGADVNSKNEGGQTPLHYAASRNRYEVMHCSHHGLTSLLPNQQLIGREIAELLLQSGAYVDVQDKTSAATPLHRAASQGHSKIVKLLLNHNASCNIQDAEGNTALHMACEEDRAEIAVTLVENGASLYIENKMNMPPVELANKRLARQLIRLSDS
ncbi:26S proteasome non-ATPase regulatory subunit 10-like isoform X1 [Stylophora pistillata]|uniref:26S proteasome non-ATPase regulatory subunit 10-like isoform X1 n=1 Tax=Stylophora pistillata TaxID=50429 RepID=UPI000C03D2D5|nr:26S proteasome non-ATPase regulatory subunit 10-like isoform X1 [Stylophora pistillata]